MALSGSFSGSIVSGHYTLRVDWSATQSVANNTSKITAVMYLVNDWRLSVSAKSDNSTTIAGTAKTWPSPAINGTGTTKLATVTSGNIAHNADGTKSVAISATFYVKATISGTYYEKITASATVTLNTIPRATTPTLSASSADMGASITISTPRASSSFTHDLAYSFAGGSYVNIATGVATSKTWTVPDLASKIPNATSGTVTIRCITKNGSTTIGTKTVLLTAKVPTSVIPTVSSVTAAEATNGLADQFGALVQNKSKVKVTIKGEGVKGSNIKAYQATLLGKTYTTSSWTSGVLTGSGTIKLRVKDSRGRWSNYAIYPITVLPYYPPEARGLRVYRVDEDGNAADDGERLTAEISYDVAPVGNKNTASAELQYKLATETDDAYTTMETFTDYSMTGAPVLVDGQTFSTDYSYDIRLAVTDWFGVKRYYTAPLPSGAVILDLKADGTGVAFFKTSVRSGVEIQPELPGSAVSLLEGTDLNDLRAPGFYAIASAAVSASLANKPYTNNVTGCVLVLSEGEDGQRVQILRTASKNYPAIYERHYYGGTWGSWACVYNGANTLLWSGAHYMQASQTVDLPQPVSAQPTGIVLVFSQYTDGAANNNMFYSLFVPKSATGNSLTEGKYAGNSVGLFMCAQDYSAACFKKIFVTDTKVTGHDSNVATGTGANGITYNGKAFVMRFILGV